MIEPEGVTLNASLPGAVVPLPTINKEVVSPGVFLDPTTV
jgi:hypothetical protein